MNSASDNPGNITTAMLSSLKGLMSHRPNAFSVCSSCSCDPGFSLRSNPGLELANAFGVFPGLELANALGVFPWAGISQRLRRFPLGWN